MCFCSLYDQVDTEVQHATLINGTIQRFLLASKIDWAQNQELCQLMIDCGKPVHAWKTDWLCYITCCSQSYWKQALTSLCKSVLELKAWTKPSKQPVCKIPEIWSIHLLDVAVVYGNLADICQVTAKFCHI